MAKKQTADILIVEDDVSSGEILQMILEKNKYRVVGIIESGEEAVIKARELKPDLILMDITLKGDIDGIDAAEIIQRELKIPYIYITGWSDESIFERAKKTMPLGYIIKPFNSHMITSSVELALYKHNADEMIRQSEKRNREILSYIPDIMFKLNSDGSFIGGQDREMAKNIWPGKVSEKALPFIVKAVESTELQFFDYFLKKGDDLSYYEARITAARENTVIVIVRDMTEKKKAEIKLHEYKENLESVVEDRARTLTKINRDLKIFSYIINQSTYSIIIIDDKGVVEFANPGFLKLSGYNQNDIIGLNIKKSPNLIIPEEKLWDDLISSEIWRGELYNVSRDGNIYYQLVKVSILKDEENKNITHYLIIGEDITDKKREKSEIEKAKIILDKSDITKIDLEMDWKEWKEKMLMRNISRTDKSLFKNINVSFNQGAGLGSLISLIEFLFSSSEKSENKYIVDDKFVDLILKNVDTAKTAFKTFSNIDWVISHEFDLENIFFYDFYEFIKIVKSKAEELCGIKNQKIIINDFDQNYRDYRADINKEFLYKAIYEMLINAMKFSKNNSYIIILLRIVNRKINISVTNEPEKGDSDVLGIPKEYERLVFEPFYRLSKVVYEQYKSLDFGIGLTLIEKIISKHKGEVFIGNILDHSDLKREPITKVNVMITLPVII